ncbi:hypothetical protein TNCT_293401 [Trichonephila clavata]|uniref:Uncharacterized protein n=1 Tax=Trichonephila clavata TaxID=2740835 RepID=A0A8X6FS88_TRICU|nr:hypothetical protein TNCT_293401 [Trichonephila clavata]
MAWRQSKNHSDDCYFCPFNISGYNLKNQKLTSYSDNIPSVIRPVTHKPNGLVPLPPAELPVISSESSGSDHPQVKGSDTEYKSSVADSPQPLSRVELNGPTKDLDLSKEAAELLDFILKEKAYWPRTSLVLE